MSTLSDYCAILDAMKGKPQGNGTGSKNVVLTPTVRAEIVRLSKLLSVDSLAERYHVNEATIHRVLARHVQE